MKERSPAAAEDCNFEKFHMRTKILRTTNVDVLVLLSSFNVLVAFPLCLAE
jgi:hypothetical protein